MSRKLLVLVVLVAVFAVAAAEVVELTASNFDKTKDGTVWLVEFYGPKCGHCKKMEPQYNELAAKVKAEGHKLTVARINAQEFAQVTQQHHAYPWPFLTLLKNGRQTNVDNPREYHDSTGAQRMLDFAIKKFPEIAATKEL